MITARVPLAAALVLVAPGLVVLGVLAGPAPAAAASRSCPDLSASLDDDGAVASGTDGCPRPGGDPATEPGPVDGQDRGGGGAAGDGTGGDGAGSGAAGGDRQGVGAAGGAGARPPDPYEWARAPDCPLNAPGSASEALCGGATRTCPEPGDIRYVTYQRPRGAADAPWAPVGVACLSSAEAAVLPGADGPAGAVGAAPVLVVTGEQFQRLPFAPGTAVTQPPGGELLINVPAVVHAVGQVQVLPTVVLGVPVAVRATPATWGWDFGDGAALGPVADPGAPWPAGPHAHTYLAPGRYAIVMSTTYTGEFSVDGGPWEPIDGTSTVTSVPQAVVAHSARSRLVADTLG